MRPNKVETPVKCFRMSHVQVFAGFSGCGNSIHSLSVFLTIKIIDTVVEETNGRHKDTQIVKRFK